MSLLIRKAKTHSNASTQIDVPGSAAAKIIDIGKKLIPDEVLAGEGRVQTPHVSLKYGVVEDEQKLRAAMAGIAPFTISLGKTEVFTPSESGDASPVVVEVHGHQLDSLHNAIQSAMGTQTDEFPYIPHITVAYVKPEEADKYAGNDMFAGISFTATAVTLSKHDDNDQVKVPLGKAMAMSAAAPAPAVQPEIPQVQPPDLSRGVAPQPEEEEKIQRDEPAVQEEQEEEPEEQGPYSGIRTWNEQAEEPEPQKPLPQSPKGWRAPKKPVTETRNFKRWFGKSKVVDRAGKPMVVYHGTTHEIDAFDPNATNTENWYGQGLYFTDSKVDAAANYATDAGPDITVRIETLAENIEQGMLDEGGLSDEDADAIREKAHAEARERLLGPSAGVTMPVYLSLKNPVIVQKRGGTEFQIDYDEETGEESGNGMDLYNAILLVAGNWSADGQSIWSDVSENGPEFNAGDFEKAVRGRDDIEDSEGSINTGGFIGEVYQEMGYDGIIMDAESTFGKNQYGGGMEMSPGTKHYIVWDPSKVKSAIGNRGKFDPKQPGITAAAQGTGDLTLANKVMNELFSVLGEANLPKPTMKIVNQPRANWLGRDTWRVGIQNGKPYWESNTTIDLQRSILNDENTLRRIIAHELAHHADALVNGVERAKEVRDLYTYKSFVRDQHFAGHGKGWKQYAQKFNAKYGADFVTEKSDQTYVEEDQELRPYNILLKRDHDGKLAYEVSTRMTAKAKRYLDRLAQDKSETEHRLAQTNDRAFMNGFLIGSWYWVHPKEPETQQKLEELWSKGQKVLPSGAAKEQDELLKLMRERMTGPGWLKGKQRQQVTSSLNKTADYDDDVVWEYAEAMKAGNPNYRQKWSLVPAARVKKIWNDYAKTGMVRDEKGMENISALIIKNIYKLQTNTILTGHESTNPERFGGDIMGEELPDGYFEQLEHFFDDDNGAWRISDYAMAPLMHEANKLEGTMDAEEQLQIVDRILNIVHARSDLASWFVQGGTKTLNSLAGKKAAMSPEQQERMESTGNKIVEEKTIGDYEFFVGYDRNFGVYQIGMQRAGMDFSDMGQQFEKQKQDRGAGSLEELKQTLQGWLAQYHLLFIGSMNPEKTMKYIRLLKAMGFNPQSKDFMGMPLAYISDGTVKTGSMKRAGRKDDTTSMTLGVDSEDFPSPVLIRWEQGMRWRSVLSAMKRIVNEIAEERMPWRDIFIWASLWENYDGQQAGWEEAKAKGNRVMFDILHNGSFVSVGMPYQAEAVGMTDKEADAEPGEWVNVWDRFPTQDGTYRVRLYTGAERKAYWNNACRCWQQDEKPAKGRNVHRQLQKLMSSRNSWWLDTSAAHKEADSHKVTPLDDTYYNNPEIGEETNAYADIPERVRGNYDVPSLHELVPQMWKEGGELPEADVERTEEELAQIREEVRDVEYTYEINDSHRGELSGEIGAYIHGKPVGFVQFGEYGNVYAEGLEEGDEVPREIGIKYVYVAPRYRRMGIGTGMYEKIKQEFPGEKIVSSGTTERGGKFRRKLTERGVLAFKSALLNHKEAAYAEGQNQVQHTDQQAVGMSKVLKSDPFAEEIEILALSMGKQPPEPNPTLVSDNPAPSSVPKAEGEEDLQVNRG